MLREDIRTKKVYWKASARRQEKTPLYNSFQHFYPRSRISFRSSQKLSRHEEGYVDRLARAIRYRINGGSHFNSEKPPGRIGARWIHFHAEEEIKKIITEIDEQSGPEHELDCKVYYINAGRKTRVVVAYDIKSKERALVYIVRNWINPLHSSQLARIIKALKIVKRYLEKQGYKKIGMALFTPELENQRTLTEKEIYHYFLPYIQPLGLNKIVKEDTGIDLKKHYPGGSTWIYGIKELLKGYLWRRLLPRLYKKRVNAEVQKEKNLIKAKSLEHISKETIPNNISNVENLYITKRSSERTYPILDIKKRVKPSLDFLHKTEYRPQIDPFKFLDPPKKPLSVRYTSQKKRLKSLGKLRTYVLGPYFYRRVSTSEGIQQINMGSSPQKVARVRWISVKEALIQCIFTLKHYNPRNQFLKQRSKETLAHYLKQYARMNQ